MKATNYLKKGFTLVELLVVIGIIAILAGVMLVSFGGTSESARAAKCLSNLRSLAQGANSIAMEGGIYPLAGSVQRPDVNGNKVCYYEVKGWISWLSNNGDPFGHESGNAPSSPVSCQMPCFDMDPSTEDAKFAITNGTMYKAVNKNTAVYTCPSHVLAFQRDHQGRSPLWSYVMNSFFGYDYSQGSKGVGWGLHREYDRLPRADRIVMFAEIPYINPETGAQMEYGNDNMKDSVLNHKANVNGNEYGTYWKGTPESIGFNHRHGKKQYCGHVAFADGHVEKFIHRKEGGLDDQQLTALLCEGKDVSYDGKTYEEIESRK